MNHTTHPRRSRFASAALALAFGAGVVLSGCGDDGSEPSSATSTAPAAAMTVTGAWARTSPSMATAGAAYMEITNETASSDALVGVAVDPGIAGTAELHETSMAGGDDDMGGDEMDDGAMDDGALNGDGAMNGDDDGEGSTGEMGGTGQDEDMEGTDGGDTGGMMTMRPVEEIPIPAGATAVLQPGGYHVMLLDLVEPLVAGDTLEITLTFATAGDVVVEAEIRDTPA